MSTLHRRGFLLMGLSSLMFSLMSLLVRAGDGISPSVFTGGRFAFGAVTILGLAAAGMIRLRPRNWTFLFWRGLTGGVAIYLFFYAIQQCGLAKGTVLVHTYPVFVPFFGLFVLREKAPWTTLAAILAAMAGLYLVINPGGFGHVSIADLLGLSGGILSAIAVVCIKRLRETDSSYTILLSQCIFGLLAVSGGLVHADYRMSVVQWGIIAGVGAMATIGQLLMTYSYKLVPATEGSLLGLLVPVFNGAAGVLWFGEHLSAAQFLGCGLVLGASLYVSLAVSDSRPGDLDDDLGRIEHAVRAS